MQTSYSELAEKLYSALKMKIDDAILRTLRNHHGHMLEVQDENNVVKSVLNGEVLGHVFRKALLTLSKAETGLLLQNGLIRDKLLDSELCAPSTAESDELLLRVGRLIELRAAFKAGGMTRTPIEQSA